MIRPETITPIFRENISGPAVWRASEFQSPAEFTVDLADYIDDFDRVLATLKEGQTPLEAIDAAKLPPGDLPNLFRNTLTELRSGRGFVFFRGLDPDRYSESDLGMIFFLFGDALGVPLYQNTEGFLLGLVEDRTYKAEQIRGSRTNEQLTFHTDNADIVGLMCVRPAKAGGESLLASALTIHNILLEERADLLSPLYQGYFYNYGKEDGTQALTPVRVPVFSNIDGAISARLYRPLAEESMRTAGMPFEQQDLDAFDYFERVAHRDGIAITHTLQPGEFYLVNNYTVVHARTQFDEHDDIDRRRKLFRLWLNTDGFRAVHPNVVHSKPAHVKSKSNRK